MARLAERAQRVGVPLIVEVTAWGQHAVNQTDPDLLTFGCRVAAELGADLVKTPFTGDVASMRTLVKGALPPSLCLGAQGRTTTRSFSRQRGWLYRQGHVA